MLRAIIALAVGVITGATFLQDRPRVIPDGWIAHPIYTGPMPETLTTASDSSGVGFQYVRVWPEATNYPGAVRWGGGMWDGDYLTAEGDPVLARLWANLEDAAAYDDLPETPDG